MMKVYCDLACPCNVVIFILQLLNSIILVNFVLNGYVRCAIFYFFLLNFYKTVYVYSK